MKKKEIQEITERLLQIIKIDGEVEVSESEETLQIKIQSPEGNRLIGYHGQALEGLEKIIKQIFQKKFGETQKLVLDVNDYKKARERVVRRRALEAALQAKREGRVVFLPPMNSYERWLVHETLSGEEGIETLSEGEGAERKVLVRPKSEFIL